MGGHRAHILWSSPSGHTRQAPHSSTHTRALWAYCHCDAGQGMGARMGAWERGGRAGCLNACTNLACSMFLLGCTCRPPSTLSQHLSGIHTGRPAHCHNTCLVYIPAAQHTVTTIPFHGCPYLWLCLSWAHACSHAHAYPGVLCGSTRAGGLTVLFGVGLAQGIAQGLG